MLLWKDLWTGHERAIVPSGYIRPHTKGDRQWPLFPLGTFGLTAEQIDEEHLYLIGQVLDKNNQTGDTFTQYLTDRLPADFGAENLERLASFLSGMLQEKAQKRMSTAELLRHPFLFR